MPDDDFCDLALTPESLEIHHHLYRAMPEYQTSAEFREIVEGTFAIEHQLIAKGLAPDEERVLWQRWEWYGDRLRHWVQRREPDSDTVVH